MVSDFVDFKTANVYCIYGTLGGGKTLTAVEIALEFFRRGFPVVSNVQLRNIDQYSKLYSFIENFETCNYWDMPQGAPRGSPSSFRSAIIIDEVAEFFDQNSFRSPLTAEFTSWLRQSSKRGQLVFLIVQHPDFIAKSLRKIVSRFIHAVDLGQAQIPFLGIKVPFMSGYVCRFLFDRNGNKLSHGLCLGRKKDIGRYYQTSQIITGKGRNTASVEYVDDDRFFLWFFLSIGYFWIIYFWF